MISFHVAEGLFLTYPVSINNNGDVTGWFFDSREHRFRGFVRQQIGEITTFEGVPTSINERGQVAGIVGAQGSLFPVETSPSNFIRDEKGNITIFSVPNALTSRSVTINNRGDVAGYFTEHFQGNQKLINRLVELGKSFDFMEYPNRTHGISEGNGTQLHVYSLIARYIETHLPR